MLPAQAGGRIPLREYGYSTPVPGEGEPSGATATKVPTGSSTAGKPYYATKLGPNFAGREIGQLQKIGNDTWSWNGKDWHRLGR
jgi:hypothetical protein